MGGVVLFVGTSNELPQTIDFGFREQRERERESSDLWQDSNQRIFGGSNQRTRSFSSASAQLLCVDTTEKQEEHRDEPRPTLLGLRVKGLGFRDRGRGSFRTVG